MITDKYLIREQNASLVLNTIIEHQPISRADIASYTQLNKATVSSIITDLIEKQLTFESGIGESSSTGGRKPIYLTFNAHAGLALAVDVGYNYVSLMVAYLDGTTIHSQKIKQAIDATTIIPSIVGIIKQVIPSLPDTPHGIVGLSVAIHGIVVNNNIQFSPFYDAQGTQVYDALRQEFSFPIYIENEANLAALGEYTFRVEEDNVISVSIHSGIGVGIVQDKVLQTGAHGHSGEIGHTILYRDGIPCVCGNKGCLEKYASNKAIYDAYASHKGLSDVNSDVITKSLLEKDAFTLNLLEEKAAELAIGLNTLIMLYDPEVVIINSSIYKKNPHYLTLLQENLKSTFTKDVSLTISTLEDEATLYGGISVVTSQFLNLPSLKFYKTSS
ncbi:putative NBD/HSP70 family sugar kinase [Streptococcus rupicaprae]|uniref:NBD/HSP70 family sugar kinase n=1 Tax=Streptococcus rupicaprae TaxID=759619 RepID=A0ABV2FEL8_9STRE